MGSKRAATRRRCTEQWTRRRVEEDRAAVESARSFLSCVFGAADKAAAPRVMRMVFAV